MRSGDVTHHSPNHSKWHSSTVPNAIKFSYVYLSLHFPWKVLPLLDRHAGECALNNVFRPLRQRTASLSTMRLRECRKRHDKLIDRCAASTRPSPTLLPCFAGLHINPPINSPINPHKKLPIRRLGCNPVISKHHPAEEDSRAEVWNAPRPRSQAGRDGSSEGIQRDAILWIATESETQ